MPKSKNDNPEQDHFVSENLLQAISTGGSWDMMAAAMFDGERSSEEIGRFCGDFMFLNSSARPPGGVADVVSLHQIPVGIVPSYPIIKMMKSEHAELLTKKGTLRLGSIDYYSKHEDPEVRDPQEGNCIVATFDGKMTYLGAIRGGMNDRLLCCYIGEPDGDVIKQFGYDSAVEITDVRAFSNIISKKLGAIESYFSECLYVRDRAIYHDIPKLMNKYNNYHENYSNLIGMARSFLKNSNYKHQREFRFVWRESDRVRDHLDITDMNLTNFCRKIAIA